MKNMGWLEEQKEKLSQRLGEIQMESVLGEIYIRSEADYDREVERHKALMEEHKAIKQALVRIDNLIKSRDN